MNGLTFDDLAKLVRPGDRFLFHVKPGTTPDIYDGAVLECVNWPYAPVWPVERGDERCIEFLYPDDDEFNDGMQGTFYEHSSDRFIFQLLELAEPI